MREIIEAIGEDPERDGLVRTPQRIAEMYEELFAGLHEDPARHLTVMFEADHDEMVMVRDIPLASCASTTSSRSTAARTSRTFPATTAASPVSRSSPGSSTVSRTGPRCRNA